MIKIVKLMLISFSVCIIIACAATPARESAGEYLDSSTVTAKVKASLIDKLGTAGFSIQVKTFKDEVQLSGFVNTPRVKERATGIAGNVQGVKRVRNDIIVK
ncbi:BON domain-containing protein [Legionella spiritensis]|uniref:Putative periplasmic or secreted lipoprotein n=1 Tax=Legionella spiritensis TaxID=452 RepID=A0A0W0YWW9_LEGSP|nr:BON domain-containing protein [Legionella spiritensis]KTD61369.1 putative periplasmic or secreted lipoprotein [Legionella spiritensis]SNV33715.1 putative periplasmic or secreted lipoprotein [Legionella spiritensis]VEG92427.1 putative periplasmic or secreted lipoprotein [Legionella spiritensis]